MNETLCFLDLVPSFFLPFCTSMLWYLCYWDLLCEASCGFHTETWHRLESCESKNLSWNCVLVPNPSTFDMHISVNVELSTREPLPSFTMPSEKYANLYKRVLQGVMTPKCKKRNVTNIKLSPFTLHKNSTPLFSCCGTVKGLFHFILDGMSLQLTCESNGLALLQYQSCPARSHETSQWCCCTCCQWTSAEADLWREKIFCWFFLIK